MEAQRFYRASTQSSIKAHQQRQLRRTMQGRASADHTTLLLNCYTKLKDVGKLDDFLRGSGAAGSSPSLNFDVETAVKVII